MGRTKRDVLLHALKPEQLRAVELLAAGKNDRETAELLEVERTTITRWRLYHPSFQAELNRFRQSVWEASLERMRNLISKSLGVLEKELDESSYCPDRWKIACTILRSLPKENLTPRGETDADAIVMEYARECCGTTWGEPDEDDQSRALKLLMAKVEN